MNWSHRTVETLQRAQFAISWRNRRERRVVEGEPEGQGPSGGRRRSGAQSQGLFRLLLICCWMTMAVETSPIDAEESDRTTLERLKVEVLEVYPHDPGAYTQGLLWDGGVLYESTGLYGKSTLRRVDPESGLVLDRVDLDHNFFGEGLALVGDRLIQLTWKAGVAFVYEIGGLQVVDEFGFNGQGWGLAFDGVDRLVMSDGTSRLTYRDPEDFRWRSTLEVTLEGEPVPLVNELEFAHGQLYANVWQQERIVRIDPDTGRVNAVIDASGLLDKRESAMVDVLNGIAYDPVSNTFWLTGKFWPKMFRVRFVPEGQK